MKIVVPALAAAFIATAGLGSAAQAAVIDFAAAAFCPPTCTGITYAGPNLGDSTAIDLDGSAWFVTSVGATDVSGLIPGTPNAFSLTPKAGTYGTLSGVVNITIPNTVLKSWTALTGPFKGDAFTETFKILHEITRGDNEIGFVFDGFVTTAPAGSGVLGAPVVLDLTLNQAGGPGTVVSASLTNASSAIPEPSTWVMLALGFIGLGYAAVRRSAKDRSALAV
jgi:hypothetical protein